MKFTRNAVGVAVLAASLALAGCAGAPTTGAGNGSAQNVSIPDTPLGAEALWVLEELNATRDITAHDWAPRLADKLTAEMSADELVGILNTQIRAGGPYTLVGFQELAHGQQARLTLSDSSGGRHALSVHLSEDDGKISGIFFADA